MYYLKICVVQVAAENRDLQALLEQNQTGSKAAGMRATRRQLPAFKDRDRVIDAVTRHRVTVLAGAPT